MTLLTRHSYVHVHTHRKRSISKLQVLCYVHVWTDSYIFKLTIREVKTVRRLGRPQPHGINSAITIPWDWVIVRHRHDNL